MDQEEKQALHDILNRLADVQSISKQLDLNDYHYTKFLLYLRLAEREFLKVWEEV